MVTVDDVASAIEELQWVEFAVRQQQQVARMMADGHAHMPATCTRAVNPSATATGI